MSEAPGPTLNPPEMNGIVVIFVPSSGPSDVHLAPMMVLSRSFHRGPQGFATGGS